MCGSNAIFGPELRHLLPGAPKVPKVPPPPRPESTDAAAAAAAALAKRREQQRRGYASTIMTAGASAPAPATSGAKTLLGG